MLRNAARTIFNTTKKVVTGLQKNHRQHRHDLPSVQADGSKASVRIPINHLKLPGVKEDLRTYQQKMQAARVDAVISGLFCSAWYALTKEPKFALIALTMGGAISGKSYLEARWRQRKLDQQLKMHSHLLSAQPWINKQAQAILGAPDAKITYYPRAVVIAGNPYFMNRSMQPFDVSKSNNYETSEPEQTQKPLNKPK